MLRKIIIGAVIILVPIAFYIASQYGDIETSTFVEAIETTMTNVEGDQAPKVIIVTTITRMDGHEMIGEDRLGRQFRIDYTGSEPDDPFAGGQVVRFVGHVHTGPDAYFHATQVYAE